MTIPMKPRELRQRKLEQSKRHAAANRRREANARYRAFRSEPQQHVLQWMVHSGLTWRAIDPYDGARSHLRADLRELCRGPSLEWPGVPAPKEPQEVTIRPRNYPLIALFVAAIIALYKGITS